MNSKEPFSITKTLTALLLAVLCLFAANWQYQRGVDRHAKNFKIEENAKLPTIELPKLFENKSSSESSYALIENEWRTVTVVGRFNKDHEVLLRNRYNEDGKYGYEYLTLFNSNGKNFWIDRGWVQAGDNALDRPKLPETPNVQIELTGRIRLDNSLPRGSFFALPATGNLINSWDLRSKIKTEEFYLDLISGPEVTPDTPAQLPELSDGPHLAYALQWIFFAGLIIYGRYLIRKPI